MSPIPVLLAIAALSVPQEEYQQRRMKLRQALPHSAIVLSSSPDTSGDPHSAMLQEPNFYYLTGWKEPGAVLIILPSGSQPEEILFLPPRNERKELYEGHRVAPGDQDAERRTGVKKVMSTELWEAEVKRQVSELKHVYTAKSNKANSTVSTALAGMELMDASNAISKLRMVKSAREVEMLQQAIDVTLDAHLAAWKRAKAGLYEYQVAATMTEVMMDRGCERHAYRPIVGSGPNSVILHYAANRRNMDRGEVLLMDVGAECNSYTADITRTIPVSGKFTTRQREIYDLVLGAQRAAIAAVKPGAQMGPRGELVQAAKEYMDKHGKPINGNPPSKYFIHGIGHHVGLEVHDASVLTEPLAEGMVITIEPGIYIPEEGLGVRIEDMVLVTADGSRVLSSKLPTEAAEVEKRLAHK